ncbi:MAG: TPM domain-containing protein [Nitrospiraceae bacterium]
MATGKPMVFTEEECRRIEASVRAAEQLTRAEIVPMVVLRSGYYRETRTLVGAVVALLVLVLLLVFEAVLVPWGWHAHNAAWMVIAVVLGYGLGWWLGGVPSVARLFVSHTRRTDKVRLRAERAFSTLGVGHTRERTGVLLMVSLFERQLFVLADNPLADRVGQAGWQSIIEAARPSLHDGRIADGICAGIARCGELLRQALPADDHDNPNELSDGVRIEQ